MKTLNPIFTTYLFDVEVATPIHVGMAQEKNYVRGLDYVLAGNEAWVISTDKLLTFLGKPNYSKELQELTLALASGNSINSENTLKKLLGSHPDISYQRLLIQGVPSDGIIRRMYRTGMGQYAVPGSSIKGAIRSVLLAELKKQPGSNRKVDELTKLMGDITNNLMRFIQVGDLPLSEEAIKIRRAKIYSADGDPNARYDASETSQPRGEWKDSGRHNKSFKGDSFITFYEVAIPQIDIPYPENTLCIRLGTDLPHKLGDYVTDTDSSQKTNVPSYNYLLANKPKNWLLDTIRAHTRQYLLREKTYFKKFQNKELKDIDEHLNELLKINDGTNSCLLRVGAGVGFHSITGDWQEQSLDHFSEWNHSKGYLKNKTRKFVFEQVAGEIEFALMGFIKLTLQTPESVANRTLERQQAKQQAESAARLAAEAEVRRLEEERLKTEEAKKPKLFEGPMKQGQELDAEIVKSGRPNKVKVYASGYDNKEFDLIGYAGPEPVGKVVVVKVDVLDKKKNLTQIRYQKFK